MTGPSHAVFVSHAAEDAPAAQRISDALRAAGIEVWYDQSELRGGDVWDRKIRREIHDCALFLPVISQHTQDRLEGYFRLEWRLAVDRSHLMAVERPFLVPVVVDGTREPDAVVPDAFREVQWTRLPNGETPPAFVERIQRLLADQSALPRPSSVNTQTGAAGIRRAPAQSSWASNRGVLVAGVLAVGGALAYFALQRPWISRPAVTAPAVISAAAPAAFSPPPHSIAVLPFVNMSGDHEQEYFSDGLTEELLNSLSEINELQVAARTSAFSFKGTNTDIGTIARKLNVGAVLEGSVRRSGNTVRVTTQLINAVTGFHLWSHTYDHDLTNVLKLQTEIADAVASALKVSLLGDLASKIELGGTRNPGALDAYLRASKTLLAYEQPAELQAAIGGYSDAIRQDPGYALAFAFRSVASASYARNYATGPAIHENKSKALADANKAIALAPQLAEAHYALATILRDSLDFSGASEEYQRAVTLGPGNARLLAEYGEFATEMGRTDTGLAAARRAVVLDPLSPGTRASLGWALMPARRYQEAVDTLLDARRLGPTSGFINAWLGFAYYALGDYPSARSACESADGSNKPICFALTDEKLGRHADAQRALSQLQAETGDASALFYAMIFAEWGNKARALDWLEVAMRERDPYLIKVRCNPFFDPLRREPRFQAIYQALKFPD
ncbi:MAG: TIR domain-containing protein [Gammaproteobacteria bacterium]|nr:TIR domain-containing protein [Gammaproteobacteria bacterium]